jgi:hypothetical protein
LLAFLAFWWWLVPAESVCLLMAAKGKTEIKPTRVAMLSLAERKEQEQQVAKEELERKKARIIEQIEVEE